MNTKIEDLIEKSEYGDVLALLQVYENTCITAEVKSPSIILNCIK